MEPLSYTRQPQPKMPPCPSLETVIKLADHSDFYLESAEDFLADHRVPLTSHSTANILTLAWHSGWRPF